MNEKFKKLCSPKDVEAELRRSGDSLAHKQDLERIERLLNRIMATQTEIVAQLNAVNDKLKKIATEESSLVTKIEELQAIIDGMGDTASPELVAAAQAVSAQADVLDALVPDAPPPAP